MSGLNGGGLTTPGRLADALDHLRDQLNGEPATTFSDDRVFLAAQRLAEVLDHQLKAAEVVRGARRRESS